MESGGARRHFSSRCERRWHSRRDLNAGRGHVMGEPGKYLQQREQLCQGPEAGTGLSSSRCRREASVGAGKW